MLPYISTREKEIARKVSDECEATATSAQVALLALCDDLDTAISTSGDVTAAATAVRTYASTLALQFHDTWKTLANPPLA